MIGEWNTDFLLRSYPPFTIVLPLMMALGLIFPISLMAALFGIKRVGWINALLFFGIFINIALIIRFVFQFYNVSSTDFRYYAPTYAAFLVIAGVGIERILSWKPALQRLVTYWIAILFMSEILWIFAMIVLRINGAL
jgi:hypothetical protein